MKSILFLTVGLLSVFVFAVPQPWGDYHWHRHHRFVSLSKRSPQDGFGYSGPRNCPDLSQCRVVRNRGAPVLNYGDDNSRVCIYSNDNVDTCNLSSSGSYCSLEGKYYGPTAVRTDQDGTTHVDGC